MTTLILTKSDLFTYAWVLARAAAKQSGRPVREGLSAALKCAWAARKADAARHAKAQAAEHERRMDMAVALTRLQATRDEPAVRRSHWRPLGQHLTGRI